MRSSNIQKIKKQRGQSMVEYLVVTAAIIAALYSGEDVMNAMHEAWKGSYEGYSYTISIAEIPDDSDN